MTIYVLQNATERIEFANEEAAINYAIAHGFDAPSEESRNITETSALDKYKALRIIEIDRRTQELIREGFVFDGQRFSLSVNAQLNWMGVKALSSLLSFPVECTTFTDGAYMLTVENVDGFVGTAAAIVNTNLEAGRALKVAVIDAETEEQVNAVVDER